MRCLRAALFAALCFAAAVIAGFGGRSALADPMPYPGKGELQVAVPLLQSEKLKVRLPHAV